MIFIYSAILIITLFYIFDKEKVRIEWISLGGFLVFIVLANCIRLGLMNGQAADLSMPSGIDYSGLMWVWWEDAVFVLPFFFLRKVFHRYIVFVLWIVSSAVFAYGHLYQGYEVMALTALYPFFISYRYGKKYGMGTVMVAHVLFDFSQIISMVLYPYLVL